MPWSSSDRREELPSNWDKLRQEALDRDGRRCRWSGCGQPATDVDHVRRGNDHRLQNLQSLCAWHHQIKTNQESAAERREQRAKLSFPNQYPKHPGLR